MSLVASVKKSEFHKLITASNNNVKLKEINMRNKIFTILVLCTISIKLIAQTEYLTESEKDIYWQPNTHIDFSDYQSKNDSNCIKYNSKYGLKMSSNIGLRGVVDIPKRSGKMFDKFYLAPVFCKNCSCILSEDSLGLKVDRLLFDIAEACSRNARKELFEIHDKMNADNTYTMVFTTVKNKWDQKMRSFFGTVIREVLIEKKDSAYYGWRKTTDEVLLQNKSYATRPEDCSRFVLDKPIEKGYVIAKTLVGDMRKKDEKE